LTGVKLLVRDIFAKFLEVMIRSMTQVRSTRPDNELWRIGKKNGSWDEFGGRVGGHVTAPENWAEREEWHDFPCGIAEDKPLSIIWMQEQRKPLLLYMRFLDVSCESPIEVEVEFNGTVIYSHKYEPAVVWLHKHFDISLYLYLPIRLQRIGENILTFYTYGNDGKVDLIELREASPSDEMWLFSNFRTVQNVLKVKEGVYPLEWIDFDCSSVAHHELEPERGKRVVGERWADLQGLYGGMRLRPMSNIWGVPKWNSKYIKTGKASNPEWKEGCGKVIHYHDYWVGGDLLDYDAWEDFVTWHVKRTKDWVKLYRGLGEWDVHWFGNGGSWEGFYEYTLRYGRAIKQNDPDSFVILSGNHTWDYVRWHADIHGLPKEAWTYYEKLTDNREIFRWVDALGYHPYEYNNSNPNSPWIAAEHLRTLLDRKGLSHIRVAVDEWGHDLGYSFVREALPRLLHNGVINVLMVDWCIVEGEHPDSFGLVYPDGRVKNSEAFECWQGWSELFHGAKRTWCAVLPEGSDTKSIFFGASTKNNTVTIVLDNRGSNDATVRMFAPLPQGLKQCLVYVSQPKLNQLKLVSEIQVDVKEGEAEFALSIPAKTMYVLKILSQSTNP